MLLRFLEVLAIALFVLVAVTQIVLPVIRGQKLFPFFSKQATLEEDLAEAVQERVESEIKAEIGKVKAQSKSTTNRKA